MRKLFRVKYKSFYSIYKFFGVPVWRWKTLESAVLSKLKARKALNVLDLDDAISKYVSHVRSVKSEPRVRTNNVAFLATELYDTGGHTECIKNVMTLLFGAYPITLFLTRMSDTHVQAPHKMRFIQSVAKVDGVNYRGFFFSHMLFSMYSKIIESEPKVLFVFLHMDDVFGAALLALLRQRTDIKIVYFNHGSHYPALGMSMADLILEGMPSTHYATKHFRGIDKCHVVGLPTAVVESEFFVDDIKRASIRHLWQCSSDDLVSLTGCNASKLFEGDSSHYFEMVKRLLACEVRLKHVVMSSLSSSQRAIVDRIFHDAPDLFARLVFTGFRHDYEVYFQSCDVFIDSFPVSSALTYIDLMRNRVPFVAKINSDNSLFSFHEYLDPAYPYMHEDISCMESSVLLLLKDAALRKAVAESNYLYFQSVYGERVSRKRYVDIIERCDDLHSLYDASPSGDNYHFRGLQ